MSSSRRMINLLGSFTLLAVPCPTSFAQDLPPLPMGAKAVRLEVIASGLNGLVGGEDQMTPTDIVADGSGRLFVTTLGGVIRVIDSGGNLAATPFMTRAVSNTTPLFNTWGMTTMAFHPDFSNVATLGYGKFYTITTEPADPNVMKDFGIANEHQDVIKEWTMSNINDNVFSGTEREVLRIGQNTFNHNFTDLAFGNDDYLYISAGDDASGVQGGQNLQSAFGKVLRFDPLDPNISAPARGEISANGNYRVPTDNPFFATPNAVKEIWAYGFRSPYRMNFDKTTGELWLGDVGQQKREEVNLIEGGGNYGWSLREGSLGPQPAGGSVDPVFEYEHDEGHAVIDGFTYRGTELSKSIGDHIFGDWLGQLDGGRLFYGDPSTGEEFVFLIDPKGSRFKNGRSMPRNILTIGQDENNELYLGVIGRFDGGAESGLVIRLRAALLADFDDDGTVDPEDLDTWEQGYGIASGADPEDGDANGDGIVSGWDFLRWQLEYSEALLATSSVAAVPEPSSSLLLVGLAGIATLVRLRADS